MSQLTLSRTRYDALQANKTRIAAYKKHDGDTSMDGECLYKYPNGCCCVVGACLTFTEIQSIENHCENSEVIGSLQIAKIKSDECSIHPEDLVTFKTLQGVHDSYMKGDCKFSDFENMINSLIRV